MARKLKPLTRKMITNTERDLRRRLTYELIECMREQCDSLFWEVHNRAVNPNGCDDSDPPKVAQDGLDRAIRQAARAMVESVAYEEVLQYIEDYADSFE